MSDLIYVTKLTITKTYLKTNQTKRIRWVNVSINFHFKHVFLSEDPWILLVFFTMYRIGRPNSEKILKGEKSFAICSLHCNGKLWVLMKGNYLQIRCWTLVSRLFAFFVFPDVTFTLYLCITSDPLLNGILHQVTSIKDKFTLYVAIFGGILGTWGKIHFINYRRFATFVWHNKQAWLRKHKVT